MRQWNNPQCDCHVAWLQDIVPKLSSHTVTCSNGSSIDEIMIQCDPGNPWHVVSIIITIVLSVIMVMGLITCHHLRHKRPVIGDMRGDQYVLTRYERSGQYWHWSSVEDTDHGHALTSTRDQTFFSQAKKPHNYHEPVYYTISNINRQPGRNYFNHHKFTSSDTVDQHRGSVFTINSSRENIYISTPRQQPSSSHNILPYYNTGANIYNLDLLKNCRRNHQL